MTELPLKVNDTCSYTKTISESDVYLYAGITGDFSQMHMNAEFMKTTPYKERIVHGVLTFSFGCTASTLIQQQLKAEIPSVTFYQTSLFWGYCDCKIHRKKSRC